jgi:predicted dehydrogenase
MLWLIGTGAMARAYFAVLQHLAQVTQVIGRSAISCQQFKELTGHTAQSGGIQSFLAQQPTMPSAAIVAVDIVNLYSVCRLLLLAGVKKILLEKPGALYQFQLEELQQLAEKQQAQVLIAYNRRFFQSVQTAKQLIAADGAALSCHFEVTEWTHQITALAIPSVVKQKWLIANTAHVMDLVFYLCGEPQELQCQVAGSLDWHPSLARLTGCGHTTQNTLLSYHGDWQSAGRWSVDICTPLQRLIFRPLEQLQQQAIGSIELQQVLLPNDMDQQFKPGLMAQTQAFLRSDYSNLCDLATQRRRLRWYEKMAHYPDSQYQPNCLEER